MATLTKTPFELPYMVHVCTSPVVAISDNFVQFYCSFAQHWTKLIEMYMVVHFKHGRREKDVSLRLEQKKRILNYVKKNNCPDL